MKPIDIKPSTKAPLPVEVQPLHSTRSCWAAAAKHIIFSVAKNRWLLKTHLLSAPKPKHKLSQQDSPLVHTLCFAVNICKHTGFMAGGNSFEQFAIKILASSKGCGNASLRV